jgi:hypothetical protein
MLITSSVVFGAVHCRITNGQAVVPKTSVGAFVTSITSKSREAFALSVTITKPVPVAPYFRIAKQLAGLAVPSFCTLITGFPTPSFIADATVGSTPSLVAALAGSVAFNFAFASKKTLCA